MDRARKSAAMLLLGLILGIQISGMFITTPAEANYNYLSRGYLVFRTVSATEDTVLTGLTQKTAPVEADDGTVAFMKPIGAVHIVFIGTDAENLTLSWYLWGYKSISDPAEYIAHGTAVTGASVCSDADEFYADTIVITDQQWLTPASVIYGAPETVIAGGGIAKLAVDTCEYQFLKIQIRDIAGGGSEAATAGAKIATIHR